ncbi:unnamed protein product [Lampetra fluviatilis]
MSDVSPHVLGASSGQPLGGARKITAESERVGRGDGNIARITPRHTRRSKLYGSGYDRDNSSGSSAGSASHENTSSHFGSNFKNRVRPPEPAAVSWNAVVAQGDWT